jgi:hypothetical protein
MPALRSHTLVAAKPAGAGRLGARANAMLGTIVDQPRGR